MKKRIFYIIGKSGSGKDTIFNSVIHLFDQYNNKTIKIKPIIMNTTRPIRKTDIDGVTYNFVSENDYLNDKNNGLIIEERSYVTIEGIWRYYTTKNSINLDKYSYIGIGTLESLYSIRKYYGDDVIIPILIKVSDEGERLKRLITREQQQPISKRNYKEICRRYIADEEDFSEEMERICVGKCKTYTIKNDLDPKHCHTEIASIISTLQIDKNDTNYNIND